MLAWKMIALVTLSSFLFSGGGASGCHAKQNADAPPSETPTRDPAAELKVLAEGFHSSIQNPFVAVIRDAETYSKLTELDGNLPKLDAEFFKTKAVVAAFLGERNTGGYSVEITREGNTGHISVVEKAPGKGVMVTQMITSPFKIVAVPAGVSAPLWPTISDSLWPRLMQKYRVTSGIFRMSGGIAGRVEEFGLEGQVRVMREGNLATFGFLLKNAGETNEHMLFDFTTGIVDGSAIRIHKLSAATLIKQPNSGLRAEGRFADNDHRLFLEFTSLPSMIADGYSGRGSIEAVIEGSPAKP